MMANTKKNIVISIIGLGICCIAIFSYPRIRATILYARISNIGTDISKQETPYSEIPSYHERTFNVEGVDPELMNGFWQSNAAFRNISQSDKERTATQLATVENSSGILGGWKKIGKNAWKHAPTSFEKYGCVVVIDYDNVLALENVLVIRVRSDFWNIAITTYLPHILETLGSKDAISALTS